jgi:hypothetical protein
MVHGSFHGAGGHAIPLHGLCTEGMTRVSCMIWPVEIGPG